jgi:hypothetical protein
MEGCLVIEELARIAVPVADCAGPRRSGMDRWIFPDLLTPYAEHSGPLT